MIIGIKDAFVTAYYNGKKISVDEAKKIALEQGSGVVKENNTEGSISRPLSNTVEIKNPELTDQNSVDTAGTENTESRDEFVPVTNTAFTDTGIVYKVQIGAFRDEIPTEIANKFIRIAKQGIKSVRGEDGLTVYSVG